MSKNIVLIGFMGVGKSTVSKHLGQEFNRDVFSTDQWIQEQEKRSIEQIFKESGESYFREVEKRAVNEASRQKELIIDCGGGVVLDSQNIKSLKENGIIFYLSACAQMLYKNIKDSSIRPLLQVEDPLGAIEKMLSMRDPLYRKEADIILDTNNQTCDQIAREVADVFNKR